MRALRTHRFVCRLAVVSCLTSIPGCAGSSDGRQSVSGSVTFDGAPIEAGRISFRPVGPGQTAGAEIREGEYRVEADKGVPPGVYRVAITAKRSTGETIIDDEAGRPEELFEQYVPARYNRRTELEVTVEAGGENEFPFELTSDRG